MNTSIQAIAVTVTSSSRSISWHHLHTFSSIRLLMVLTLQRMLLQPSVAEFPNFGCVCMHACLRLRQAGSASDAPYCTPDPEDP